MHKIKEASRLQERWRFRQEEVRAVPARLRALGELDDLSDIDSVLPRDVERWPPQW